MITLPGYFILDADGEPGAVDVLTWAAWSATHRDERVVLQTFIDRRGHAHEQSLPWRHTDGVTVSTVFLGLDHNWANTGPPVLWETMIFGGPLDQHQQWRYTSKLDALRGHAAAVGLVLAVGRRLPRRLKLAIHKGWMARLHHREARRVARFRQHLERLAP